MPIIAKIAKAALIVTFWAVCMGISLWLATKVAKVPDKHQKESLEVTLGMAHLANDVVALVKLDKLPSWRTFL